ncbi:MAG TPA: rhomboid family intramembrane serine protease [Bacteroidia bacterium]|nr:rhomboid family intramembrane serine protease [Bacteroidia bacterium]
MSITEILVGVTCIISIAAFYNRDIMHRMIFNPYMISERKQWYRFFSSGFIHSDWIHLFVNMIVLWSFGQVVEEYYQIVFEEKATFYYLLLYFGGMLISITPSYKRNMHNAGYNALGASGAVSSVLFAAILFQPLQKIYLYGIIGLPGILLGAAYLVYSYYMNKKGNDNVNHDAHFWGAVFGMLFTVLLKPTLFIYFLDQLTSF